MQPAEIDDPADTGRAGRLGHVLRADALGLLELVRATHRVHEVVDDVHVRESSRKGFGIAQVAASDLDVGRPRNVGQFLG